MCDVFIALLSCQPCDVSGNDTLYFTFDLKEYHWLIEAFLCRTGIEFSES